MATQRILWGWLETSTEPSRIFSFCTSLLLHLYTFSLKFYLFYTCKICIFFCYSLPRCVFAFFFQYNYQLRRRRPCRNLAKKMEQLSNSRIIKKDCVFDNTLTTDAFELEISLKMMSEAHFLCFPRKFYFTFDCCFSTVAT